MKVLRIRGRPEGSSGEFERVQGVEVGRCCVVDIALDPNENVAQVQAPTTTPPPFSSDTNVRRFLKKHQPKKPGVVRCVEEAGVNGARFCVVRPYYEGSKLMFVRVKAGNSVFGHGTGAYHVYQSALTPNAGLKRFEAEAGFSWRVECDTFVAFTCAQKQSVAVMICNPPFTQSNVDNVVFVSKGDAVDHSAGAAKELPVDVNELATLGPELYEKKYVHDVYENIADHFSNTRYKGWPRVSRWVSAHSRSGTIMLDVGCGNGKYSTSVHPQALWIGTDYSANLLGNAREISSGSMKQLLFASERKWSLMPVEVFRGDALNLPLVDGVADACICIAVLHHITSRERRILAIRELLRLLKNDGALLIYVWAKEQQKGSVGAREFQNPESKLHACHMLLLVLVKWATPEATHLRFYKAFEKDEIVQECQEAGGLVTEVWYDSNNWGLSIQKNVTYCRV